MQNKNNLEIIRTTHYTRIEICCDTQHYDDSINFILKVLSQAAKGNKLFVEYYGSNQELENPNNAIDMVNNINDIYEKKLWMRDIWLENTNKSFTDERYAVLCVFDYAYSWEDFIESVNGGLLGMIRTSQLRLLAIFGDCEPPCIYLVKERNLLEEKISNHYTNHGFVIKKHNFVPWNIRLQVK